MKFNVKGGIEQTTIKPFHTVPAQFASLFSNSIFPKYDRTKEPANNHLYHNLTLQNDPSAE